MVAAKCGPTSGNTTGAPDLASAWSRLRQRGWLSERSAAISEMLRAAARLVWFDAAQHLYYAGDRADGIYGLVEGSLDISIPRADGQDLTFHRADPGFWIGDLALFASQYRLVTVRAATQSVLVHLPQAALGDLLTSKPALYADFYMLSYRNVEALLQVIGNLSITPSDARVALRLLFQAEQLEARGDWIHLSRDKFAELLGLSVPTLQRALSCMEKYGLVELGYGKVRILDAEGLLRLSSND